MTKGHRYAHQIVGTAVLGLADRIEATARRVVANDNDSEAVHDFRVAVRRLRTVLRSARKLYGKKRVVELEECFRGFGDATGALRDAEVLRGTLAAASSDSSVLDAAQCWLRERGTHELALRRDAIGLLQSGSLNSACRRACKLVTRAPKMKLELYEFADRRLGRVRRGVRDLLPVDVSDVERLHRLRIRFKRLRYTSEMLGQFIGGADASVALGRPQRRPEPNYAAVARLAARIQKVLGNLHDADLALQSLASAETLSDEERLAISGALEHHRGALAAQSLQQIQRLPVELLRPRAR